MEQTDELVVRMTALEWNQVLGVLGEGTFRLVSPLINKIGMQCQEQIKAASMSLGNGKMEDVLGPVSAQE